LNKRILFVITCFLFGPQTSFSGWGETLLGKPSEFNKVNTGAALYHLKGVMYDHVEKGKDWWFRPTAIMTYNSYNFVYFKNTHRQDTVGVGQERTWYTKHVGKKEFVTGYRYGAIYGYCIETDPKLDFYCECKKNFRAAVHPMAQAFFDYSYDDLGVEIGLNPGFINALFVIRFN
jgi:hypothetical protein